MHFESNSDNEAVEYFRAPCAFAEHGMSNYDFLLEQLGDDACSSSSLHETTQAVLDLGSTGLIATPALLLMLQRWNIEEGKGQEKEDAHQDQNKDIDKDADEDDEIDDEIGIYTFGSNSLSFLQCIEATERISSGVFSSSAVSAAVSVALAPSPDSTISTRGHVPPPHPEACAAFALAVLKGCDVASARARPCRFYMAGQCMRADCRFLHDVQSVPCRHWLLGGESGCTEGISCAFAHDEAATTIVAQHLYDSTLQIRKKTTTVKQNTLLEETNFPALPGAKQTPRGNTQSTLTSPKSVKDELLEKFVFHRRIYTEADTSVSTPGSTRPTTIVLEKIPADVSTWVEGGCSISEVYSTIRSGAAPLARARNALFEQATKLYRAGKGAEARRNSQEGQLLHAQLLEYQQTAAKQVFRTRNSKSMLSRGQLDLHGLHVSEADACLRTLLPQLASAGLIEAQVLTGSGHHTNSGPKGCGRLGPVARALALEFNLPCQSIVDANGYIGGYMIGISTLV